MGTAIRLLTAALRIGPRVSLATKRSVCLSRASGASLFARPIYGVHHAPRLLMVSGSTDVRRVGDGADLSSNDADVSIVPPKIPYGGFSPVKCAPAHFTGCTNPLRGNPVVTTVLRNRWSSGICVRSREAGVFDPAFLCSLSGTGREPEDPLF